MPQRELKEKMDHKRFQENLEPERLERHSVHKPNADFKPRPKKEGGGGKGNWGSVDEEIKEGIKEVTAGDAEK